ncbi:MAG: transketolase family protein [Candidatus Taylorbacteria bacterium]|nr:transketolase family protein [Candidatus Taylorbacteria bacterium]
MLNPTAKINPRLFDQDVELVPIRRGFGEGLLAAAEKDARIVGLCADLTESTQMHLFKKKFPERFIELGVAEQNLAAVASGLAAAGKIPFITSYAVFSPGRNWEQIRTTICYNNVKVVIVGSHGGVSVGPDGGSHQALEDIALTRVLPHMTVLVPCDAIEAKKATMAAAKIPGPVYLRLARENTPVITTEDSPFEVGKGQVVFGAEDKPADAAIISIGALLARTIRVAAELEKEGLSVKVVNLGTVKPLDEEMVLRLAEETGALVTAETHQVAGGMGSAIAELLSRKRPTPIEFIGVQDMFGQSGTPNELMSHYGMDEKALKKAVKLVLTRKNKTFILGRQETLV